MLTPSERRQLEQWIIDNDNRLSEQNAKTGDALAQAWEALDFYFTEDLYGRTRRRLRDAGIILKHWGWKPRKRKVAPSRLKRSNDVPRQQLLASGSARPETLKGKSK